MDDMYDSLWRNAPSNVLPVGFGWAAGGPRLFALYLSMRGPDPSMSELTRRGNATVRRYVIACLALVLERRNPEIESLPL